MSFVFKDEKFDKHRSLVDAIKASLTVEGDVIEEKEQSEAFYQNLPEGITRPQVEELQKYTGDFINATAIAVGEKSMDIFKGDETIERTVGRVGLGNKDACVNIATDRKRSFMNPKDKDGDRLEKALSMSINVTNVTGRGLKGLRQRMSEMAEGKI